MIWNQFPELQKLYLKHFRTFFIGSLAQSEAIDIERNITHAMNKHPNLTFPVITAQIICANKHTIRNVIIIECLEMCSLLYSRDHNSSC